MDPLSAIGLVSSVITFIDFGYEVVKAAREVRASASGALTANRHIEFLNTRMEAVATDLSIAKSSRAGLPADVRRLTELADKCLELSNDLKRLLDELRASNPKSMRKVLRAIARNMRKKDEKHELEARLDQCRQQLHLQLSHTTRLESLSRLSEIAETGNCHQKELESLNQQMALIKDVVTGLNPHSKLQDEARAVLDLSDLALSKVVQNRILEALRFEKMESRFDSIEEAHTETFKWLIEDSIPSSLTRSTEESVDPWYNGIKDLLKKEIPVRSEIRQGFTNWLSDGNGIFHISGKPGAGKSTLLKYLSESDGVRTCLNVWTGEKKLVLASFFFWRHGTDQQKSLQGLLRSLLHSVLDQHPHIAPVVLPAQCAEVIHNPGTPIHFRESDIREAFVALTKTPEIYLKHKFAFFIDGLDEFEGHDDKLVKTLIEWADLGSEDIKICVSSRELPIFQQRFSNCPKFRLHEVTRHDIFLFVYDTLRNNEEVKAMTNPSEVAELGRALVQRAEGVFLWVSLALRLVERGLVLEESVPELHRSIEVLPSKLEELFRVIFDSIKTERDFIKRRKAMRALSLALDELQVPQWSGKLFLTHLSFMDDYDCDPDFARRIQHSMNALDRNTRLSRCQKQVAGGCRGLLTIRSYTDGVESSAPLVIRKEVAALTHRSLIEFFKIPEVRGHVEEYSQEFDRLHFYAQSLLGELKVWPFSEEYNELETPAHTPETSSNRQDSLRRRINSELLYGASWLMNDIGRLIALYYHDPNLVTSSLLLGLRQIGDFLTTESSLLWRFNGNFTNKWACGPGSARMWQFGQTSTLCHSEACVVLAALECGLYQLWPTDTLDNDTRIMALHLVESTLGRHWLGTEPKSVSAQNIDGLPFDTLLRSLASCLAHGTSANSLMPVFGNDAPLGHHINFSIWQNLVWKSIVFNPYPPIEKVVCPALVWLLFLLHGAERDFTLSFEKTCNFSATDKSGKLVQVTGRWGPGQQQVHSPIFYHEAPGTILEPGKSHNWSLSLKELTYIWFAPHADKFRKVYELFENGADVHAGSLKDLRREMGLDPQFWQTQVCEDFVHLTQHDTEGESWVLELFGPDGTGIV